MAANYSLIKLNSFLLLDSAKDVIECQLATDLTEMSMNIVLEEQLASCVSVSLLYPRLFAIKPWKVNAEQVSMLGN